MRKIHLLCNAHLDPVWLWRWDEGAAEAISTFKIAADFCEKHDAFIFNHNEAVLYKWVKEFDIELFKRIQSLVAQGKWHILGGWYLQPDCNMPAGEAIIRQILIGRKFFKEEFNKVPATAINFDSFGHSRGLVQILKKSGYDSYVFCRPFQEHCALENEDFIWVGYDGSKVMVNRGYDHYLSHKGKAVEKICGWIKDRDDNLGLILWGVGNHGGGASKIDLDMIDKLMNENDNTIIHSTPENYFADLNASNKILPEHIGDINSWGVGCYTSQVRIKQKYRELENECFYVEKMATLAYLNNLIKYPDKEINEAIEDLAFCQFHDVLPGSSIKITEEDSLRKMDHGLEILSRLKTKIFLIMSRDFEGVNEENLPIMVYNPHPYKITETIECEFQLANQNWENDHTIPIIFKDDEIIVSQLEQEASNLNLDWRKKIIFTAELEPLSVNRFVCKFKKVNEVSILKIKDNTKKYTFTGENIIVDFDCEAGLIDNIKLDGFEYINSSIKFNVLEDNEDTWAMFVSGFNDVIGEFTLMDENECNQYCGNRKEKTKPIRIIEDGDIRTVVECLYKYNNSFLIAKYSLPKKGGEIKISFDTYFNEPNKMIKLHIQDALDDANYIGQVMFGTEIFDKDGKEKVSQKWCGLFSEKDDKAMTIINKGIYGSSYLGGINLTILRTCAYAGHPINNRLIIPDDRHSMKVDQGERSFSLWLNFGDTQDRKAKVNKEALIKNQKPYALSFYPSGGEKKEYMHINLTNDNIELSALKKAEMSDDLIIRLYNPLELYQGCEIHFNNSIIQSQSIDLSPYEVRTFIFNIETQIFKETNLIEGII